MITSFSFFLFFFRTKLQHSVPEMWFYTTSSDNEHEGCLSEGCYWKIHTDHAFKTLLKSFSASDHITFWSHLLVYHSPPSPVPPFYSHFAMFSLSLPISPFLLLTAAAPTTMKASSSYFRATSQNCFHTFFHTVSWAKYTTFWRSKRVFFPHFRFLT